jgi:hypothetical protein
MEIYEFESVKDCIKCGYDGRVYDSRCFNMSYVIAYKTVQASNGDIIQSPPNGMFRVSCPDCNYFWFEHCKDHLKE